MANKTFTLRTGSNNDSGDFVLESQNVSIDLWADFGASDDDYWMDEADKLETGDYPASALMVRAHELALKMAEDYKLSGEPNAIQMLELYCTYMLTEALYMNEE